MKKIICIICALSMLVCTNAFAAGFTMEDNPDYKTPVKPDGRYSDTSKCVDFNDKSTKDGENFKSRDLGTGYSFSWITGPSGEDGDFAPYVEAKSGDKGLGSANLYLYHLGTDGKMKEGGGTVIAEFDLKVNTTTDRFIIADSKLWNNDKGSDSRTFLDETGHVRGTDFTYKAGEWMHIRMQVCYDTNLWNVWIDDEKAVDNMPIASRYSWDKDTRFSFFLAQVTEKAEGEPVAGFALDNFFSYAIGKDISGFVSLEISDAQKTKVYDSADAPVRPVIELSFDESLNASLINSENIVITNLFGTIIECDYDVNGSDISITPKSDLDFETEYRIKISDELRKSYNSYRPLSGKLKFTTGNHRDFVISDVAFEDGVLSLNLTNNTGDVQNAGITVAVYNNSNGLKELSRKNLSLESGETKLNEILQIKCEITEGDRVKMLVSYADDFEVVDEELLN